MIQSIGQPSNHAGMIVCKGTMLRCSDWIDLSTTPHTLRRSAFRGPGLTPR